MVTVRNLIAWKYSSVRLLHDFVMTLLSSKVFAESVTNHKSHACAMHNKQAWLQVGLTRQNHGNDDKLVDGPLLVSDVVSIEFGLLIHVKGNLTDNTEITV